MRNLAAALKTSNLSDSFLKKLSGGMQERLQQELDLTRQMTPAAITEEKTLVIKALKQLVKEGFITINKTAARPAGTRPSFMKGNIGKMPGVQTKATGLPSKPGIGAAPNLKPKPGAGIKPVGTAPKANPTASPALKPKPAAKQTLNLNTQQKKV